MGTSKDTEKTWAAFWAELQQYGPCWNEAGASWVCGVMFQGKGRRARIRDWAAMNTDWLASAARERAKMTGAELIEALTATGYGPAYTFPEGSIELWGWRLTPSGASDALAILQNAPPALLTAPASDAISKIARARWEALAMVALVKAQPSIALQVRGAYYRLLRVFGAVSSQARLTSRGSVWADGRLMSAFQFCQWADRQQATPENDALARATAVEVDLQALEVSKLLDLFRLPHPLDVPQSKAPDVPALLRELNQVFPTWEDGEGRIVYMGTPYTPADIAGLWAAGRWRGMQWSDKEERERFSATRIVEIINNSGYSPAYLGMTGGVEYINWRGRRLTVEAARLAQAVAINRTYAAGDLDAKAEGEAAIDELLVRLPLADLDETGFDPDTRPLGNLPTVDAIFEMLAGMEGLGELSEVQGVFTIDGARYSEPGLGRAYQRWVQFAEEFPALAFRDVVKAELEVLQTAPENPIPLEAVRARLRKKLNRLQGLGSTEVPPLTVTLRDVVNKINQAFGPGIEWSVSQPTRTIADNEGTIISNEPDGLPRYTLQGCAFTEESLIRAYRTWERLAGEYPDLPFGAIIRADLAERKDGAKVVTVDALRRRLERIRTTNKARALLTGPDGKFRPELPPIPPPLYGRFAPSFEAVIQQLTRRGFPLQLNATGGAWVAGYLFEREADLINAYQTWEQLSLSTPYSMADIMKMDIEARKGGGNGPGLASLRRTLEEWQQEQFGPAKIGGSVSGGIWAVQQEGPPVQKWAELKLDVGQGEDQRAFVMPSEVHKLIASEAPLLAFCVDGGLPSQLMLTLLDNWIKAPTWPASQTAAIMLYAMEEDAPAGTEEFVRQMGKEIGIPLYLIEAPQGGPIRRGEFTKAYLDVLSRLECSHALGVLPFPFSSRFMKVDPFFGQGRYWWAPMASWQSWEAEALALAVLKSSPEDLERRQTLARLGKTAEALDGWHAHPWYILQATPPTRRPLLAEEEHTPLPPAASVGRFNREL